jgi:hypothetical protein
LPLADFPRIRLAHLPTPLEPLPRLSEALGGPSIWVKRDDCTGLGGGGSKDAEMAQAGGPHGDRIDEALDEARKAARSALLEV